MMVEVTQEDRQAAASVAVLAEMRELILSGRADHHAEPWAAYRIAAEQRGKLEGARLAIEAAAEWFADRFSEAVQSDCENGVKWLNKRAAKAYLREAPDTLAAIREGEDAIRALSPAKIVGEG